MNEEFNIRPATNAPSDVDRKASREYIFGKRKVSTKARCCECGVECDKSMMAWVGEGVYKCRLCLLMRRNDEK
jgi:late competence protein required for DNA uptake (superfamily II DNA/RNA helicase)